MKKILVLFALLLTVGTVSAQIDVASQAIDSIGTATTSWQAVNLGSSGTRNVTVINNATVFTSNLRIALAKLDTLASRSLYQKVLLPGQAATFEMVNSQYVWVKTTSGTAPYSVSTAQITDLDFSDGSVGVGTISFTRPVDDIVYSANDAISNSTSAPNFVVIPISRVASGNVDLLSLSIETDTANVANSKIRAWIFWDSLDVGAINDNAQFTLLSTGANQRVGYVDFDSLITEGTGSTSAFAQVTLTQPLLIKTNAAGKAYLLLEAKQAYHAKKGGVFTIRWRARQR